MNHLTQKLNHWRQTLLTGSFLVLLASFGFNVGNYLFVLFMGRTLSVPDFGTLTLLSSFFFLIQIPGGALGNTVQRYLAFFDRPGRQKQQAWVTRYLQQATLVITLAGLISYAIALLPLQRFFRLDSVMPLLWFLPVLVGVFGLTTYRSMLQGLRAFPAMAGTLLVEGLLKLGAALLLTSLGFGLPGALLAFSASIFGAGLASWLVVQRRFRNQSGFAKATKSLPLAAVGKLKTELHRYFFYAAASAAGLMVLFSIDIFLIKHLLPADLAGQYALLSLFGKIIIFGGGAITIVALPTIARNLDNSRRLFAVTHGAFLLIGAYVAAVVGGLVLLPHLAGQLLLGSRAELIVPFLPRYSIAVGLLTLGAYAVNVQVVRKRFWFAYIPLLFAAILAVLLGLNHQALLPMVIIFQRTALAFFVAVAGAHFFLEARWHWQDLQDLLSPVAPASPKPARKELYILIFNWRDTRHVWSGGAEVYLHELAKRWVKKGHHVTLFCGNDRHSRRNEVIDGVQIVRRGGFFTVYLWAALYYLLRFRSRYDVVIDSENGVPFFTPLYVRVPVFLLIHHVHQEVFRKNLLPPFSWLAMGLEGRVMPLVYRNAQMITISKSSQEAILKAGLTPQPPQIIYPGVDINHYRTGKKAKRPLVAYIGRLKAYKSLPVLIKAFAQLVKSLPQTRLVIAGFGEERKKLEQLASKLGLTNSVRFLGKVSEQEKVRLYQRAWVAVNPSSMEGWGITSIEANACGTPVVAANVPGLRDSVSNPYSGYLVQYGDVDGFAQKINLIITNRRLRERLSRNAPKWAARFEWHKSAQKILRLMKARRKTR